MTWNISPVVELGGVHLRIYSLLFALAFLTGYLLFRWQWMRRGGDRVTLWLVGFGTIIAAIVGGRFAHVLFYEWSTFVSDPIHLVRFGRGGLASHGTVTGMVAWLAFVAWWRRASLLDVLDCAAFSTTFGAGLVRLGNFFNSEIVGRPTEMPWGVRFPLHDAAEPPLRHPVQLYELVLLWLTFALLLAVDRRFNRSPPRAVVASAAFALYFSGRLFVEPFKAPLVFGAESPFSIGQLLSLAPALIGWVGLAWALRRAKDAHTSTNMK